MPLRVPNERKPLYVITSTSPALYIVLAQTFRPEENFHISSCRINLKINARSCQNWEKKYIRA